MFIHRLNYRSATLFLLSSSTLLSTDLRGVIRDPQGQVIIAANVQVIRKDTGVQALTASDSTGHYQFPQLTPGTYIVDVQKEGFQSRTLELVVRNQPAQLEDVQLKVAGVNQTVVVTAANEPQTANEVSKAITLISHDEIVNRNNFAVSDLLRTTPGAQILNSGGPGQLTTMRIRGLRPDATAFLIDGFRFRDAGTTQSDASSFLSSLNVVDVNRLEVLRGSGSSLYGTNAAGGVVNIVTDQGGGPTHGDLQVEGGNLGTFRTRGSIAGGFLKDRLRYSAGLLHLNVMSGVDGQDANRSSGLQSFAAYDITPRINLSARLWVSDDFSQLNASPTTDGIPLGNIQLTGVIPAIPLSRSLGQALLGGQSVITGNATYIPGLNDPDDRRASRFLTSAFRYRQALTQRWSWQASYQRVHTDRVYGNGPAGVDYQPIYLNYSNYVGDIDTANVQATGLVTPWFTINGGYEFEREQYFDHQDDNAPAPSRVLERTHAQQTSHSAFFNAQYSAFSRRLQISASGRAQYFHLQQPDFQYSGATNNYVNALPSHIPKALTGDISAAYLLTRTNTKLRAHFGNAYRAPSLYERFGAGFYNDFATGKPIFSPYGDPRLAPDRYNSVDTGFDQYLFGSRLLFSGTFFYTRIVQITQFDFSGLIQPDTDPYGRSSGYYNGSGGVSRGAEVSLRARPAKGLSLSGSYTYTSANTDRDVSVPGYFGVLGVPRHTGALVSTYQWTKRIDTTLDLYHYSSLDAALSVAFASRVYRFPGFTRTGLAANYRFWIAESKSARLYARIDNLLNRSYTEAGFIAPGITFVTGLGYSF